MENLQLDTEEVRVRYQGVLTANSKLLLTRMTNIIGSLHIFVGKPEEDRQQLINELYTSVLSVYYRLPTKFWGD